jgi:two-component system OmpR family sensor kinase
LKKLSQLSERLLQLARLDAGFASSESPNDLLPALRIVVDDFAADRDRIVFRVPAGTTLFAPVTLDAFAIAARNLIENALVHGERTTSVDVVVGPGPLLRVLSDGPVVPPSSLADLARPFVRGPTSANGTGIGLSIVRSIMDQSQGTLVLRSPASGRERGFEAILSWGSAGL